MGSSPTFGIMTNEENPLDYFKNLKCDSPHPELSLQDMEIIIKFHEKELAEEDKRVAGTNEYPNYGDDFADMVHIARRLFDENVSLAANQCHAGYAGEHGHHKCREIDSLTAKIEQLQKENEDMRVIVSLQGEVVRMAQKRHQERDEARRIACENEAKYNRMMFDNQDYSDPKKIAKRRDWDCYKTNTDV